MDTERFGTFLRQLRKERKISLRRLAEMTEISKTYLSRIELNELPAPSERKVKELAVKLSYNTDALLAKAGKTDSELRAIIEDRPELMGRLLRHAAELPDDQIERMIW